MTDHDHMPPVGRTTAKWLSPGKVNVVIRGDEHVLPWEEACDLAKAITDALSLDGGIVVK